MLKKLILLLVLSALLGCERKPGSASSDAGSPQAVCTLPGDLEKRARITGWYSVLLGREPFAEELAYHVANFNVANLLTTLDESQEAKDHKSRSVVKKFLKRDLRPEDPRFLGRGEIHLHVFSSREYFDSVA